MKLSVVTPSYNQGDYLLATLESIHSQGYPNLEHWVIDGGSTDGSVEILQDYARRGLLNFVSEPDKGQSDAINKGLAKCTGDVICWLNSDDLYTEGALPKVAAYFSQNPRALVVTGDCLFIDSGGATLYSASSQGVTREKLIRVQHTLYQPSTFFRRELLTQYGLLDVKYHYAMDYELWLRYSAREQIHYLPEVLSCYRLHPASKSMGENYRTFLPEVIRASRQHWGYPLLPAYWSRLLAVSRHCSKVYYEAALNARRNEESDRYLWLVSRALLHAPWRLVYWRDVLSALWQRIHNGRERTHS